ncbi:MAG: hypothetical protein IID48_13520 [Proteobacteria bacterium]|nr:hypothetical protein [Pseudomonadota bacterium]
MLKHFRKLHWLGVMTLALVLVIGAACSDDDDDNAPAGAAGGASTGQSPSPASDAAVFGEPTILVQVGQLQPAPTGAAPSGWETEWSQLIGANLIAQLDSSGDDAWSAADHPLVYVTAQGPGYGSAAFGGGAGGGSSATFGGGSGAATGFWVTGATGAGAILGAGAGGALTAGSAALGAGGTRRRDCSFGAAAAFRGACARPGAAGVRTVILLLGNTGGGNRRVPGRVTISNPVFGCR